MTSPIDPTHIAVEARQLLEQRNSLRITTVEDLARAHAERGRLRDELAAADRAVVEAYSAALKGGWTADDLAELGLPADKPARAGGRVRVGGRSRATAAPRHRAGAERDAVKPGAVDAHAQTGTTDAQAG